ncbi:hypothetical protein F3J28_06970 [Enterobacter sp. Ap-1006]|uniref:hypothetical protein n=1 Tax=Enterobacter sp. Ap-1006 TaxID=2608345 RepID=UPI001424A09B|nr:hypothetical protein [Enterobacter sp. Ap-1006]NIF47504.1 hypothetical protein [Enterobacter sp. Ap-1006]
MFHLIVEQILKYLPHVFSFFSLMLAILAIKLSGRSARLASYNMRGNNHVLLIKTTWLKRYLYGPHFRVKIYNSASSKTLDFDHALSITSLIGGIRRSQIFDALEERSPVGINKTICSTPRSMRQHSFPSKYANQGGFSFNSTPFYYYFSASASGEVDGKPLRKLNRYHHYIEITDFCGNTEIWYFSFSLHLSNLEQDRAKSTRWKSCPGEDATYKYYRFADLTIVSPADLPKNLKRAMTPQQTLPDIRGSAEEWHPSARLMTEGFEDMDDHLQLYEMREYYRFRKDLML